jgi:tRNA G10  N-methylase Trm11
MSRSLYVFKLFNSIKDEHEVSFAELELKSLFGPVERVRNFVDIIPRSPLTNFCGDDCRIQDVLTYETVYGKYQGFLGWREEKKALPIGPLIRRLAYTREILVVVEGDDVEKALKEIFSEGVVDRNVKGYANSGYVLLRAVTNQFYLEKSSYISKLSRHEQDVDKNVEALFAYPFENVYRMPASSTMAVGKRLEDYFAIREEQSLYLTHVWHPYKAKFHSRMARALLNYVCPTDDARAMDNWTGSGTLNVEATLTGIDNIGLEINPLSALMANVKCQALSTEAKALKKGVSRFLDDLQARTKTIGSKQEVTTLLEFGGRGGGSAKSGQTNDARAEAENIKAELKGLFAVEQLEEFIIARDMINERYDLEMRNFMLLALSGSISDLARRRKGRLLEVMALRLYKLMYLRLYLFNKLNETLQIKLGESQTFVCDNRDPIATAKSLDGPKINLKDVLVDGVVTSPPYSTAVDYIKNDFPQLRILGLVGSKKGLEELERRMEGNPKPRLYRDEGLIRELNNESSFYGVLPPIAKNSIKKLIAAGREPEALRSYKFFKDMYLSMMGMNSLLKIGAKAAIVIGNNHYKISDDEEEEVKNDQILFELARRKDVGFAPDKLTGGFISRPLEKTQAGYIRSETVLVLEKVSEAAVPIV